MPKHSKAELFDAYGLIADRRGRVALETTVLRNKSRRGLDLMAYLASSKQLMTAQELIEAFNSRAEQFIKGLNPERLAQFARAYALLDQTDETEAIGFEILDYVFKNHQPAMEPRHYELLASFYLEREMVEDLKRLLAAWNPSQIRFDSYMLEIHRLTDAKKWNQSLTEIMRDSTQMIEDVSWEPDAFLKLKAKKLPQVTDGPLVSVVMTSYHPDREVFHAIDSILQQTWTNFELLIIDDGSGSEYDAIYSEIEKLDSRIRVIRLTKNVGTYGARNFGFLNVSGKYVTGQDSDDWSHPRRLELQAKLLENEPWRVASICHGLRIQRDLSLNMRHGYPAIRQVAVSMMLKVSPALLKLGFFDSVRKAADSEYLERLKTVFGHDALAVMSAPMYFIQVRSESLSRTDFLRGWKHPNRTIYSQGYATWHSKLDKTSVDSYLMPLNGERKFPAPYAFTPEAKTNPKRNIDVIFVGDFTKYGGPQRSMIEEIYALKADGKRVAISQLDALRFMAPKARTLAAPCFELLEKGVVEWASMDDNIDVDLVILRYPPILQFCDESPFAWKVKKTWLVANQAPIELDGSDLRYLPEECHSTAKSLFGVEPIWVPQGPTVRKSLQGLLEAKKFADFDDPGLIQVDEWAATRSDWDGREVVVGRHSRDDDMKFPGTVEEFEELYAIDGVKMEFLGGENSVPRIYAKAGDKQKLPANLHIKPYGTVAPQDFLAGIDIYIYFANANQVEAFGRGILEALASGCLVILPTHFEPVFGKAAVYAEPSEVKSLVAKAISDKKWRESVLEAAKQEIAKRYSPDSFAKLVNKFGLSK